MDYPGAAQVPGPPANVYPQTNSAAGVVHHSAEGYWSATYHPIDTMIQRGVSWHFSVYRDGHIEQHYPLTASCWHAGNGFWNRALIGVEHEGRIGDPLTNAQLAGSVMLTRWIAAQGGWQPARLGNRTLFEHREVNAATTCPNGRIPWGYYMEADVQVVPLDVPKAIEKVQRFARLATDVIDPSDGDGMYEVISGFPGAKPGYEYIVLEMRKDG